MSKAHIYSALKHYNRPLSLDIEPSADERNGIVHRLEDDEVVQFVNEDGTILEVQARTDGFEVRSVGNSGALAILPYAGNAASIVIRRKPFPKNPRKRGVA